MLTDKEKLVLEEIKKNPLIRQEELSDKLSISRLAIATHISNLQKKGFIIWRGYFLNYPSNISIIGGINLAFIGKSNEKFENLRNNLGTFNISIKGTTYNIFSFLSKLEKDINYISFIGDDFYGDEIKKIIKKYKINSIELFKVYGQRTSLYTSLESKDSQSIGTILSMELFDNITLNEFQNILPKIRNSSILYMDANYPIEIINEVANLNKNKYMIYNNITTLQTYKQSEIKFKYNFLCTSLKEANKMFDKKLKTELELYDFLKENNVEAGMIYSKEKVLIFEDSSKFELDTTNIREYYISKIIYLKKNKKNILKEEFKYAKNKTI